MCEVKTKSWLIYIKTLFVQKVRQARQSYWSGGKIAVAIDILLPRRSMRRRYSVWAYRKSFVMYRYLYLKLHAVKRHAAAYVKIAVRNLFFLKKVESNKWNEGDPLVSIIIPCFNYGVYVLDALNSVYKQTFQNFEVIVVDGGSTDENTINVLKEIQSNKVSVYFREGRHLVGSNRNFGISRAKGKYICCLDADDKIKNTYLEKALFLLEAYKYDVVYPSVECFGGLQEIWPTGAKSFESMLVDGNSVSTVAVFLKEAWQNVGGYKDWPIGEGHVPEDWEFWTRLMGFGFRFKNIREPLMLYRVHSSGLTARNLNTLENQRKVVFEENGYLLEKKYARRRKKVAYEVIDPFVNLSVHPYSGRNVILVVDGSIILDRESFLVEFARALQEKSLVTIVTNLPLPIDKEAAFNGIFGDSFAIYHMDAFLDDSSEKRLFFKYLLETRQPEKIYYSGGDSISFKRRYLKSKGDIVNLDDMILGKHSEMFSSEYEVLKERLLGYTRGPGTSSFYSISLVLNLHREGDSCEKTILNILDTVRYHKLFGLWDKVEIVVILDKSDLQTARVVDKYVQEIARVVKIDCGDLGAARNHGAEAASNSFVLFFDGDDFVSNNCLVELYRTVCSHYSKYDCSKLSVDAHIAVFPFRLIEFPDLFMQIYSKSNPYITRNMCFSHLYNSKILLHRDLFKTFKYRCNGEIYGSEDWDMNNRLLASGVTFTTSDYVLYYRRHKGVGLNDLQYRQKRCVRSSGVYEIAKGNIVEYQQDERLIFNGEMLFSPHIRFIKKYESDIRLFVKSSEVGRFDRFEKEVSFECEAYVKIRDFVGRAEIALFAPWVMIGGADKLIIEHSRALNLYKHNAVLLTTLAPGDWIEKVEIPSFDFNSCIVGWAELEEDARLHILCKVLLNSSIKLIHIVQSDFAFKLSLFYGKILKEHGIKLIVSVYNPGFDDRSNTYYGYPLTYSEVLRSADVVLSDNRYWYEKYKEWAGGDFNYRKLFSPVDLNLPVKRMSSKHGRVLWASRLAEQKLIGTLFEICKRLPHLTFVIYGGEPEDQYSKKFLQKLLSLENVEYRGSYDSMLEIPVDDFDMFLFTSKFEGLAIARLDMVNANLPMVSADVGDSTEIFGEGYELLVNDVKDAREYCDKIEYFYKNAEYFFVRTSTIREALRENHNHERFFSGYLEEIDRLLK